MKDLAENMTTIYGIGASPGIVIGTALLIEPGNVVRKVFIPADAVSSEQDRFHQAVCRAEKNLRRVREQFASVIAEYATIIDTHILMLRDDLIFKRSLEIISTRQVCAEWGLEQALDQLETVFSQVDDPYIRERFLDVRQVVDRIFLELSGADKLPDEIDEKMILVSRDFSPEDIIRMRGRRAGFLAGMGGETSHSAIVARTLGIPAVVGLKDVCDRVRSGDQVILDGASGRVYINPQPDFVEQYRLRQHQQLQYTQEISRYAFLQSETSDGLQVSVEANLEIAEEVDLALQYGAAGIGLFRSEYLFLSRKGLPQEDDLFETYKRLLAEVSPFPVTVRTFDLGGDKMFMQRPDNPTDGSSSVPQWPVEANPALGLRAIRYSLKEPALFEIQLRALLRAGCFGSLRILFPMISSFCELQQVKAAVMRVKKGLKKDGFDYDENLKFGLMIEVPSAVAVADSLAPEVDFFSIGTNDLIQYALAIDRGNEHVAHMYEPLHPAVLKMIQQVVQAGHGAGIEVGICGEMAGNTTYLPVLLGLGLDAFSMHPYAIPYIKRMIRNSTAHGVEKLVDHILSCPSSIEIREYLLDYLPLHYPDEFEHH